ncbi:DEAD/DEAH box helicase [Salinicoccus halitifaciens]|uniref:Superfamily II DNA or RNA helicase n=1 Tax=Salinicoccus halitifaciens TaxID=1073415 RepID=A0ABV2EAY5_9STAP|nr:DEAD/DEAH box helicase [Salinicoccus halitifaciens]MCD2137560.1 DEAD/DEAH box helicase [Salinicoccus halitifaciens]
MEKNINNEIRKLINNKMFFQSIKKLELNKKLTEKESSFILTCALLFTKIYEQDQRKKIIVEFAYYIFLKYSLISKDYRPLNDFSLNFGFYPISKLIREKELIENVSLNDIILNYRIEKDFTSNGFINTREQKVISENLMNDTSKYTSYVAPTSYGKSELIVNYLKKESSNYEKMAIIVPTKSLLAQTFRNVKKSNLKRKIITHDEMYNNDESFIAILTQERALRLLNRYRGDLFFDIIYIDEAHNLFNKEERSLLIARLIRLNYRYNHKQKLIYLSPLINNSDHLQLDFQEDINEQKIHFNMKEPEIFELRRDKKLYKYNRFLNKFFFQKKLEYEKSDYINYIFENMSEKNMIYHRSPKKIEQIANTLFTQSDENLEEERINEVIEVLREYVHHDFNMIDYLKKGIIYLHGKLPTLIKEFLEYEFSRNKKIQFVVANNVILEGVNLPISTLFILNTFQLSKNQLMNLIGRVNRLDNIFIHSKDLHKLTPPIHFINSDLNAKRMKMENQIKKLGDNTPIDKLLNPFLKNFDIESLSGKNLEKIKTILKNEEYLLSDSATKSDQFYLKLLEEGLEKILDLSNVKLVNGLKRRVEIYKDDKEFFRKDLIEKVYLVFISGIKDEYFIDFEFRRLKNEAARNYYKMFIVDQKLSLKERINKQFRYFYRIKYDSDSSGLMYIGHGYGEVERPNNNYEGQSYKVYVNLKEKTEKEIINLVIIKLKMEEDFINYKVFKFIRFLYEYNLINDNDYNTFVYGTNEKKKIDLLKMGLSLNLVDKFGKDEQLKNLSIDSFGNLVTNEEFVAYKEKLRGLYKFETNKYFFDK